MDVAGGDKDGFPPGGFGFGRLGAFGRSGVDFAEDGSLPGRAGKGRAGEGLGGRGREAGFCLISSLACVLINSLIS